MGVTWRFALFMRFGGSLEQRLFTHFGKGKNWVTSEAKKGPWYVY